MIAGSLAGGILIRRWVSLPFLIAGALNLATIPLAVFFFHQQGWNTQERQA